MKQGFLLLPEDFKDYPAARIWMCGFTWQFTSTKDILGM